MLYLDQFSQLIASIFSFNRQWLCYFTPHNVRSARYYPVHCWHAREFCGDWTIWNLFESIVIKMTCRGSSPWTHCPRLSYSMVTSESIRNYCKPFHFFENGHFSLSPSRKSESRKYPTSLPITVQNVLGFILANLNRPSRLNAMVRIFQHNSQTTMVSIENGLNVLRREIEDNITYNLRVWRRMPAKRVLVLRRIQALKKFYLDLYSFHGNQRDFNQLNQLVKTVLNVWITDEIQ